MELKVTDEGLEGLIDYTIARQRMVAIHERLRQVSREIDHLQSEEKNLNDELTGLENYSRSQLTALETHNFSQAALRHARMARR